MPILVVHGAGASEASNSSRVLKVLDSKGVYPKERPTEPAGRVDVNVKVPAPLPWEL